MDNHSIELVLDRYRKVCSTKKQMITVFLTTHKRPNFLPIMINSVLKQTYSNFCLIVIDNMSKDNTQEIVNSFIDERVFYIERKTDFEDVDAVSNFDFAFKVCRTKYLVVFHDDDIVKKNYLQEMINLMEKNEEVSCMSSSIDLIDDNNNFMCTLEKDRPFWRFKGSEYLVHFIKKDEKGYWPFCPTVMYRHSFYSSFKKILHTGVGSAWDQYIYFETERTGGIIACNPKSLYQYRVHNNQWSHSASIELSADYRLYNYLYQSDYYRNFIISNHLEGSILEAFKKTITIIVCEKKVRHINRRDIQFIYKNRPLFLLNYKPAKKYLRILRLLCFFPRSLSFIIRVCYLRH